MDKFVDNDAGYLDWIAQNPDGFVLNTYRKPTPGYLKLAGRSYSAGAARQRKPRSLPADGCTEKDHPLKSWT